MLMGSCVERFEIYKTMMTPVDEAYQIDVILTKVNKGESLAIDNPNYEAIIESYPHLNGVEINDQDRKSSLPVDVVLGGKEYARIKMQTKPHVGKEGEPNWTGL